MIITNSIIITWGKKNQILRGYAVRITDSRFSDIDIQKDILQKFPNEEILDAKGQILMPGLICAHTHFYGAFSRAMSIHGNSPANFSEILQKLWWPLDQSLHAEDIKYSSMVCMIDAIKHGTTTLFDHHASPNLITGSLDIIKKSFEESGLRGVVCYEVTDRGGMEKTEEGIAENSRMIQKCISEEPSNALVRAMFGAHASLTLSDHTLNKIKIALPSGYGIHIHVAEDLIDEYDSINKCGLRVIDRLNKFDLLGENSIIAHGVHLDINEISLLKKTNTWMTHQPRSNMNNAVGLSDIDSLIRTGILVCLGNDGFSNAMWDEWRTCYLAHKLWNRDPQKMNGMNIIQMGTENNALLTSHFFDDSIGSIEMGAKADLILVDYIPFTELNEGNLPWHILFGFRDSMVTSTIVNGIVLMKERKLQFLDEKSVLSRASELSAEVWKRYEKECG